MHKLEVTGEGSGYCRCGGWRFGDSGGLPTTNLQNFVPTAILDDFHRHLDSLDPNGLTVRSRSCPINPANGSSCILEYGHEGNHVNRGGEW